MSNLGIKSMGENELGNAESFKLNDNKELKVSGGTSDFLEVLENQEIDGGASVETEVLMRDGYTHGILNIMVVGPRPIRVSISYYGRSVNHTDLPSTYDVLYESENLTGKSSYQINYPLISDKYKLKIENIHPENYGRFSKIQEIKTYNKEDTADNEYIINGLSNLQSVVETINDKIKDKNVSSAVNTKNPSGDLYMKKSSLEAEKICKFREEYFAITTDRKVKKYSSLVDDSAPSETGFTVPASYGSIRRLVVTNGGITVFTKHDTEGANIYHSADMETDLERVYTSDDTDDEFHHGFGIDSYDNGINSYVLAGVYGKGRKKRNLLLSKNGGNTFEVIKQTKDIDAIVNNSHWHDVAFDIYSGFIWAVEGDGENREIHYTENSGESWSSITKGDYQPTAIMPTPTKILFGRDNRLVGIDAINRPKTISDRQNMEVEFLYDLRNQSAGAYFGASPQMKGNELYLSFYQFGDGWGDNRIIVASGDFGETWHIVFNGETNNFIVLADIDDKYVYAYGYNNEIYFAEKPDWI